MHEVQQVLVVRVSVDRGHQPFLHAEGVVEDFDHGRKAVRGAAGVRNDVVDRRLERIVVDAHNEGGVDVGSGSRNYDAVGPRFDVGRRLFAIVELARGLDHYLGSQLSPWDGAGDLFPRES